MNPTHTHIHTHTAHVQCKDTHLEHVQSQLMSWGIDTLQGQHQTGQGLGVAQDVVLQKLVQLVEAVVVNQDVDDELVEKVLKNTTEAQLTTKTTIRKTCIRLSKALTSKRVNTGGVLTTFN